MKSVYEDKQHCCGCGACRSSCPIGAISMCSDDFGHPYPVIDHERCTDSSCKNCVAVCPIIWERQLRSPDVPMLYAAQYRNGAAQTNSLQEDALAAISKAAARMGGVVCGTDIAASAPATENVFSGCEKKRITPSIYEEAIRNLREGKTVLFIGTACRTAGMRALMKRKVYPQNLYTCDTTCRNTASPTRLSCHACPFAEGRRASDITIGAHTGMLISVNSPKGQMLFDAAKEDLILRQCLTSESPLEDYTIHIHSA